MTEASSLASSLEHNWADIGIWLVIITSGLLTFAARFSMIGVFNSKKLPKFVEDLLVFVGPAALAAIVLPDILIIDGQANIASNAQLPAFIIAAIVAYYSRNVMATITTGMLVLWIIEAL